MPSRHIMKRNSTHAAGFLGWILWLLLLAAPLAAQTILHPRQDQENVALTGKDLIGEDIPGVLFEMKVRQGSPEGKVVFERSQAATPVLSMDGLKPQTTYFGFIRIHGRSSVSMVRFFTGPRPTFGAYHPPHYNLIPGEPVEVTAEVWGAVDSVAWIDSLGRTLSTEETLNLPSMPSVAGIYTFVAKGPRRTITIPVWVRWMAVPVITGLPDSLVIPLGESRTLTAVVDALEPSLAWRLVPAGDDSDGSDEPDEEDSDEDFDDGTDGEMDDGEGVDTSGAPLRSTTNVLTLGPEFLPGKWVAEFTASNEAGDAVVRVPVEFGTAPVDANRMKLVQEEMGSDFELISEWFSTPPTHTQWTLPDGTVLPWVEGTSLSLQNARAMHAGIWTVRAINVFGTSVGHIHVHVVPRPDICVDLPAKRTVAQGTDFGLFMLPCTVGDPTLRIQWFHNGVEIPGENGTMLIRTNFTAAHAGIYSFRITTPLNAADSTPCLVTLQPTVPPAPLRLTIESIESGIRLSWPAAYELRNETGFHALQWSADLVEWNSYYAEDVEAVLVDGKWTVELPTFDEDPEWGFFGEVFRIVPWTEDMEDDEDFDDEEELDGE
jgi:hypothetical protein